MTKYLFVDKSDLARGSKVVRHLNIRKFKTDENHSLVLKNSYTSGPFLTPLPSLRFLAVNAVHAFFGSAMNTPTNKSNQIVP